MAKLFQELKRHHKFPFEVVYLVMDPGYNERNRQIIEQNAKILNIPLTIFETNIFEAVYNIENHRAISVQECGAVIFTAKQKSLDATRLHWDIILTM